MCVFRDYHCDRVEIYTCIFLTLFLSLPRFKLRGSNCSSRPSCHAPLSAQQATIRTIRHYPHNAPLFAQPPPSRAPFVTRLEALRHRRVSPQPVTRVEYRRPGTTGYRCVEAWGWRAARGILEGTRKCIMMRRDVFVDLHLIVDMPEHVYGRMQTFMQWTVM